MKLMLRGVVGKMRLPSGARWRRLQRREHCDQEEPREGWRIPHLTPRPHVMGFSCEAVGIQRGQGGCASGCP